MPANPRPDVVIRPATAHDIPVCADICYRAFASISAAHNFPCDFPHPEAAAGAIGAMFSAPDIYCVVAETNGRILGSNCLDERSIIHGIGPITVDPETQNHGVGRKLMEAVIERSQQRGAAGARLVQAAFHNRSLSLYASLGFDIREPLAVMQGRTRERSIPGCTVRPATDADLPPAMRSLIAFMVSTAALNSRKPSSMEPRSSSNVEAASPPTHRISPSLATPRPNPTPTFRH